MPLLNEVLVHVKDCVLFCRTSANNGIPLVFVPGGPGLTPDYFLELAALSKDYQIIFYDPRATGNSTGEINDLSMTMEQSVEDLEAVRSAFNFESISIVCHSSGALVGIEYALKYRKRVKHLILLNSMSAIHNHDPSKANPYMDQIRGIKKSEGFAKKDPKAISQAYQALFRPFFYDPNNVNALNLTMTPKAAVNSILIREAFEKNYFEKSYDYQKQLNQLNIKALIIHGENDLLPFSISENLHQNIRDSTLVSIPKCGHFPNIEQPKVLFEHVDKFLLNPT